MEYGLKNSMIFQSYLSFKKGISLKWKHYLKIKLLFHNKII